MQMTAGVVVNRPIDHIFAFVVNMENLPLWASGVVDARRMTSEQESIGTTYRIAGRVMGREVASTYELTAYAPPTTFVAIGTIGPFPIREVYTFSTTTRGTRVHVVSELEPRGVARLLQPVMAPLLARVIQGDLNRLKRRLEA